MSGNISFICIGAICRVPRYLQLLCLLVGLIPLSLYSALLCLTIVFALNSILSDINIGTLAVFWLLYFFVVVCFWEIHFLLRWERGR